MRQHPSAPNAVAIVSREPNVSAAQRRMFCGVSFDNAAAAFRICSCVNGCADIVSPSLPDENSTIFLILLLISAEDREGAEKNRRARVEISRSVTSRKRKRRKARRLRFRLVAS